MVKLDVWFNLFSASGSRSADDEAPNVPDGDDKSHRGEPSKSASQDGQKVSEDPDNPWSGPVKIAEEKSRFGFVDCCNI